MPRASLGWFGVPGESGLGSDSMLGVGIEQGAVAGGGGKARATHLVTASCPLIAAVRAVQARGEGRLPADRPALLPDTPDRP